MRTSVGASPSPRRVEFRRGDGAKLGLRRALDSNAPMLGRHVTRDREERIGYVVGVAGGFQVFERIAGCG